jgi:hypothetical protein
LAQHPLKPVAEWYKLMASNGITATSEHTYQGNQQQSYQQPQLFLLQNLLQLPQLGD